MKKPFAILFFLVSTLNLCRAQDTLKRDITLFNESDKIDSLLSSIIRDNIHSKETENDSCFVLSLNKTNNDVGFIQGIRALNHKKIIPEYAKILSENSLGYFEFRGYLVFVYGDEFMMRFFEKTKSKKEFTFIKSSTSNDLFTMNHFMMWFVFYHDGQLSYGVH